MALEDNSYVKLQQARKNLRHRAHQYAHAKKDSNAYYDAVEQLEAAASLFAVAALAHGMRMDDAAPANGPARIAREKATNPEPDHG